MGTEPLAPPEHRASYDSVNGQFCVNVTLGASMSMKDLDVEIEDGSLIIECQGCSDLNLRLPEGFDEDELRCQFDKAAHMLTIKVPAPEPPASFLKAPTALVKEPDSESSSPNLAPSTPATSGVEALPAKEAEEVKLEEVKTFKETSPPTAATPTSKVAPPSKGVKKAAAAPPAAPAVEKQKLDEVAAMGRSMVERLRESGAVDDAAAMEDVLRQMEAAAKGELGSDGMSALDQSLDSILKSASEGIPDEVVEEIKEKAPQRWKDQTTAPPIVRSQTPETPVIRSATANRVPPQKEKELTAAEEAAQKKEQGNAEFKKKRYPAAVNRYSEAIRLDPNFTSCYSNRSLVYFRMGEFQKAHDDAKKCIEVEPGFVKGYMRLAAAQIEMKQFAEAKTTVRAGLEVELDEPELLKLLREIKQREWDDEYEKCETQEDKLVLERDGVKKAQERRQKEEEERAKSCNRDAFDGGGSTGKKPSWEDEIEIEDVVTPGAAKALEQEDKAVQARQAKRKAGIYPQDKTKEETKIASTQADPAKVKAAFARGETPAMCVKGLIEARNDFGQELRSVWNSRQEVFYSVWNSDKIMEQLGGRLNALANVIENISKYPKKPFGLQIDQETFFKLLPELSPPAVNSYNKEPNRFFALLKEMEKKDWKKDTQRLYGEARMEGLVIEVGGYHVPFDEATPVTPTDDASMDFGSRLEFYGNLRALFLTQTSFLIISIMLAQAVEKKLIGAPK